MAVGVPENEVFAAADAVLARGDRPTVERVRLALGRGSPARVGSLLDQWWAQLAGRLRGETRLPGLPAEVAQAFVAIWQQAMLQAQVVAEQALITQRQMLAEEREQVAALEANARLDAAQARQQTAGALAARHGVETRLADLEQLLNQRQAQIEELREQRDDLQTQRDDSHAQLVEVRQQLQDSREQAEQSRVEQQCYTRDVENRVYREIDLAREQTKGLAVQLKEANDRLQTVQQGMLVSQSDLAEAREERFTAQSQAQILLGQLNQARQAELDASEQLQALQQTLQNAQAELASARQLAAVAQARAEILSQQVAAFDRSATAVKRSLPRKAAPKTR